MVPQHLVVGLRLDQADARRRCRASAAARASHAELGEFVLRAEPTAELLFCENETNNERLLFGSPNASPYVKDGINEYVVHGASGAVNPDQKGTKVGVHHTLQIAPGASASIKLRLTGPGGGKGNGAAQSQPLGAGFDQLFATRRQEADDFYATLVPKSISEDAGMVMRQALAGMLWGKQYYEYEVHRWLREHGVDPWDQSAVGSTCATCRGST